MKRINKIKQIVTISITMTLLVSCVNFNNVSVYANEINEDINVKNEVVTLSKNDVPDVMTYDAALKSKHIKRERKKENGLNEIIFQNQDGSHTLYVYDQNVKFIDDDGGIKDIDTGIETIKNTKKKGYTYTNGANVVNVDFPDIIKDGLVVGYDKSEIKMYPTNYIGGKLSVSDDKAIYDNIYGAGTQLIYTPTLNGVKEEIVLEKYNKKEKYTFVYVIGNGYISTLDDDCLYIYSENDELLGLIEPIYMIDANNKYNSNSKMDYYKNEDGTWTVEIIPDKEFLTAEDTVYPVIIDPTYSYIVNYSNNNTGIQDITINSTSTSAGYSGSLFVGNRNNTENGISRILLKVPSITNSICSSIEVQSATVTLRDVLCESFSSTILCCQFEGSTVWNENTVNISDFYGNVDIGDYDGLIGEEYDRKVVSFSQGTSIGHIYSFDVTVAAKEWINSSNKRGQGLIFKSLDESTVRHRTFASYQRGSYQPTFTMVYLTNSGAFEWEELIRLNSNQSTNETQDPRRPPNCAGYALGKNLWLDGFTSGFNVNLSTIGHFAYSFKSYVDSYVVNRNVSAPFSTDWRKTTLESNQYLIATRIGSDDFHFMIQMKDGKWSDKQGTHSAVNRGYINPKLDVYWEDKYTSDTVYMIVTVSGP